MELYIETVVSQFEKKIYFSNFLDKKNQQMAEEMEDEKFSDLDLDYLQFKRQQLSIFKHDYRETVSRTMDEAHQSGFQLGFNKSIKLSKKIGRLKGTLVALQKFGPDTKELSKISDVQRFVNQCESLLDKLASIKSEVEIETNDGSEFTVDFAKKSLPDFNGDDMDLFFGNESASESLNNPILSKSVIKNVLLEFEKRFDEIQNESNLLFDTCCPILRSYGICDEFLYKI